MMIASVTMPATADAIWTMRPLPKRASASASSSRPATTSSASRVHSPDCSWSTTASRAPGTRSAGPCAALPDWTAISEAAAAMTISVAAAGEAKPTLPESETSRSSTPITASAITKWTTIGWYSASAPSCGILPPPLRYCRPRVRLRRRHVVLVAIVVSAVAAGAWYAFGRGPKPTLVQTAVVGREDLQAKVTANGKLQAQKKVDISATIAGQVTRLAVEEGDRVRKGQFLLQIDPVNPRAAARSSEASMQALLREQDAARASLEQASLDLRRAEENHRGRIIADAELDRARTARETAQAALSAVERRVEQARATLEGARDTLAKTTVVSPMDGIVTARRVEEGEVAVVGVLNQPGTVLLTISDMSVVEAEMDVDETSIPSVK